MLIRCLNGLENQAVKPSDVFIFDNASDDGTSDYLIEQGYYDCYKSGIQFHYHRNCINIGGAGGFCEVMKIAFEFSYFDAFWMMDDDGVPEPKCLSNLVAYLDRYDYIAPIVLSDEDKYSCSFALGETIESIRTKANNGLIYNFASPFNGILYSRRLIESVGFPKKEMFIWGDEQNYHLRAIQCGMIPVTVVNAVHYHPIDRCNYVMYKGKRLNDVTENWKLYCYLRNRWYNKIQFSTCLLKSFMSNVKELLYYCSYYKGYHRNRLIFDAFFSALKKDFSRLEQYR